MEELKKYLEKRTVKEAAKDLKVSRQTIYNWLSGKHSLTLKNWRKIIVDSK